MITVSACGRSVNVMSAQRTTNESVDFACQSRIFGEWFASLDPRFKISSIEVQAVDFRGIPSTETVMFVRMKVMASNTRFSQIVELRGGTVILLPILLCDGEHYTILVQQPRLASGSYELLELPAGMIDEDTFKGAAAREMQEELGLTFYEEEMRCLTNEDILLSPGLLDEHARVFVAQRNLTSEKLNEFRGKATGLTEEGENITLKVIPLSSLHNATRDAKALIALALYKCRLESIENGVLN